MAVRSLLMGALLVLGLAACAGRMPPPAGGPGAVSAVEAAERFMQLARESRYLEMGWIFGTSEGAIIQKYPASEVERRMYGIAEILKNDILVVGTGTPVPGRTGGAELFRMQLRRGNLRYEVPLTAVRGPGQRWFVEQVAVDAVTNAQ